MRTSIHVSLYLRIRSFVKISLTVRHAQDKHVYRQHEKGDNSLLSENLFITDRELCSYCAQHFFMSLYSIQSFIKLSPICWKISSQKSKLDAPWTDQQTDAHHYYRSYRLSVENDSSSLHSEVIA